MGKKKKRREEEYKPWCFYCDRLFVDETTLILHQKAKHFKCAICHKKMTTAPSLAIHCTHVHKLALSKVPSAKAGRDSVELEIFGMAGVPEGLHPGEALPLAEDIEQPLAKMPKVSSSGPSAPPPLRQPITLPFSGFLQQARAGGSTPQMGPYPGMPGHPTFLQRPMHLGRPHMLPYGPAGNMPYAHQGSQPAGALPFATPGVSDYLPTGSLPSGSAALPAPGQPLFPIASGLETAPQFQLRQQGSPLIPVSGTSAPQKRELSTPESGVVLERHNPVLPPPDANLVWRDISFSMEERRAEQPKYEREWRNATTRK